MSAQNILQQSVHLMQRGDFTQARRMLQELAKKQPDNADAWQLLAACDKNLGKLDSAMEAFRKSLHIQHAQPHTWNNLANLHLQRKEYDDAIHAYRKAIQLKRNYDSARINLALALTKSGNNSEALNVYAELLKKHPGNSQILLGIGDCLRGLDRPKDALTAYTRALDGSHDKFLASFKLGLTHKELRDWDSARNFFQESLKLNPVSGAALSNLASLEAAAGDLEKAITLYTQCVQLEPENPDHHKWLNKLLWACKKPGFLSSYEEISQEKRYNPDFLIDKCKFLRLTGSSAAAEQELTRAIALGHRDPAILAELAASYRSQGRISAAVQLLEKPAAQIQAPLLRDELGRAYLQAGEFNKCAQIYQELTKIYPENQGFWCMQATALQQLQDPFANELLDYQHLVKAIEIPAPPGFSNIREFNRALAKYLEQLHNTKREPVDQSLSGGTQTLNDLFDSEEPLIQLLKQSFRAAILEHLTQLPPQKGHPFLGRLTTDIEFSGSWSVSLKRHGHHLSHFHTEGWISSAYYVEVPADVEKNGEGWIEFGRPEFPVPGKENADYIIKPKEGMLVIFPSYMWHGTRPFNSSNRRMTVAFDAVPK